MAFQNQKITRHPESVDEMLLTRALYCMVGLSLEVLGMFDGSIGIGSFYSIHFHIVCQGWSGGVWHVWRLH